MSASAIQNSSPSYLYRASGLSKTYGDAPNCVNALIEASFTIETGEFVVISGPSGSGKSTLLGLLGLLAKPSDGVLEFAGREVRTLDHDSLAALRNEHIGFVFQAFQLLPRLSALENVELPLVYSGTAGPERQCRAKEALVKVGLEKRLQHHPSELSGGEQQRVAIARAMVNKPKVILADEPTGALDTKTGEQILSLLQDLNKDGTSIVVITHNLDIAKSVENHMILTDGRFSTRPLHN